MMYKRKGLRSYFTKIDKIFDEDYIDTIKRKTYECFDKVKIFTNFDYTNYIDLNIGRYKMYFYNY